MNPDSLSLSPTPFFTIITPTIQRDSLFRACASADKQTFQDFEHLIVVDQGAEVRPEISALASGRRRILQVGYSHDNDFGHTARWFAHPEASGRYLYYYDDDNYFADDGALQRIHDVLVARNLPDVAFVPIRYLGRYFFPPTPPRVSEVDMGNIVVERKIGRFPRGDAYGMDGLFAINLAAKYHCEYCSGMEPVIALDAQLRGRPE